MELHYSHTNFTEKTKSLLVLSRKKEEVESYETKKEDVEFYETKNRGR